MRLIIPASDTQCLHFSPPKLRFEQGFILAGAREIHSASAWGSAWVLWSSDSGGRHPPKPHGFLHFFLYSSNFRTGVRGPNLDAGDIEVLFLAMSQGGHSLGLSQTSFSQEASIFQRKKFGSSCTWRALLISFCSSSAWWKPQVSCHLLQKVFSIFPGQSSSLTHLCSHSTWCSLYFVTSCIVLCFFFFCTATSFTRLCPRLLLGAYFI